MKLQSLLIGLILCTTTQLNFFLVLFQIQQRHSGEKLYDNNGEKAINLHLNFFEMCYLDLALCISK